MGTYVNSGECQEYKNLILIQIDLSSPKARSEGFAGFINVGSGLRISWLSDLL
jgi:hypothetical protein